MASRKLSSRTSHPSRTASSVMQSGGQILMVQPCGPTGENISSPFATERHTMSFASAPSRFLGTRLYASKPRDQALAREETGLWEAFLNYCESRMQIVTDNFWHYLPGFHAK